MKLAQGKFNKHATPYWSPTLKDARGFQRTGPEVATTPHIYYIKKLRLNSDVNNANTLSQIKTKFVTILTKQQTSTIVYAKTKIENLACVPLLQSMTYVTQTKM